jgi:hypothetical protein
MVEAAGGAVGGCGKRGFLFSGKIQPSLFAAAFPLGLLLFDPTLLMGQS